MKRIASFEVNHDKLKPGMYTSRIDGDITTYDIRMVYPNAGTYIQPAAGHTFEHLFATYARNSKFADQIIYCGPMGCQTGFYLLIRNADNDEVLRQIRLTLCKIIAHEGEVFGASSRECGNYRSLSLDAAKTEARRYLAELDARPVTFIYEE
jgi:S-ribosylhomocysteine lyase